MLFILLNCMRQNIFTAYQPVVNNCDERMQRCIESTLLSLTRENSNKLKLIN